MTFREKLADWISGGALSRAREAEESGWECESFYWSQLHRIAAMETPGANATVRRMAKTAREALE